MQMNRNELITRLQRIQHEHDFNALAIELFYYQAEHCEVYSNYLQLTGRYPVSLQSYDQIPALPIGFFKTHRVACFESQENDLFFESSSTGGIASKHFIKDFALYEWSFMSSFKQFFSHPNQYLHLALLPGYLERKNASLVAMINRLVELSDFEESGFFLHNHEELHATLLRAKREKIPTILWGVSFALLDFLDFYSLDFPELILMETGGMKGKRKEIIRAELHQRLTAGFGVEHVHSEYGMTELFSQAYSMGNGIFQTPPWMKVLIRDASDPFELLPDQQTGGVNVIDLANIDSCAFIE
ncbi:MAG: hypothetical protein RL226_1455, partial [Bacteroidota bacterium]